MEFLCRAIRRLLNILGQLAAVVAARPVPAHPARVETPIRNDLAFLVLRGAAGATAAECSVAFPDDLREVTVDARSGRLGVTVALEAADYLRLREVVELLFAAPGILERVRVASGRISVGKHALGGQVLAGARCVAVSARAFLGKLLRLLCETAVPGERAAAISPAHIVVGLEHA